MVLTPMAAHTTIVMGKWIFAILFGGVASVFIIAGAGLAWKQHDTVQNAQPVLATITGSEVVASTYSSKGRRRTRYNAKINYDYTVAGQRHTADDVYPGAMIVSGASPHALVGMFPVEKTVEAFYDRRDPKTAFLIKHHDFGPYLFILFPMLHLSIGLGVALAGGLTKNKPPVAKGKGKWELPTGVPIAKKFNNAAVLAGVWWIVGGLAVAHFFSVAEKPYDQFPLWASGIYLAVGIIPLWIALHYFNLQQKFSDAVVTTDGHPALRGHPLKLSVNLPLAGGGRIESAIATLVCRATIKTRAGGKTRTSTSDVWTDEQAFARSQDIMSDRTITGDVQFTLPDDQPPSSPKVKGGYPVHQWEVRLHVKRAGPDYKARFPIEVI